MDARFKKWLASLLVVGLTSCDQVIDTQPYLVGRFVGSYQPDNFSEANPNDLLRQPLVLESYLTSTNTTRYDFAGTVRLADKLYNMSGYEESFYGSLAYLQPQAAGVYGYFLMNLQNELGSSISICGEILYGSVAWGVTPQQPTLQRGFITSGQTKTVAECTNVNKTVIGSIYEFEQQP